MDTAHQVAPWLLPALIVLGLGVVASLGALVWLLVRSGEEQPREDPPSPSAEDAAPAHLASTDSALPSDTTPFLAVRRSGEGLWAIFVEGVHYASLAALPEARTRRDVMSAVEALTAFAPDHPRRSAAVMPPAGNVRTPVDRESLGARSATTGTGTESAREPSTLRASAVSSLPTIDFAQEISEILDEMLAQEPGFGGHAVRLMNRPGGGVSFAVDGAVYHDIADIPNPAIRALIRRATKEWERR